MSLLLKIDENFHVMVPYHHVGFVLKILIYRFCTMIKLKNKIQYKTKRKQVKCVAIFIEVKYFYL